MSTIGKIYRIHQTYWTLSTRDDVWVKDVTVVGTKYRSTECYEFIRGVLASIRSDNVFGTRLLREPDNPHDKLAVAVYGFCGSGRATHSFKLGYIPRRLAFQLHNELGSDQLVDSVLSGFRRVDDGFDILINILEP